MAKMTKVYNTVEDAMAATGTTSPRAALEKLKAEGRLSKKGTYLPHVGAKQRAKAARAAAKVAEKKGA